MRFDERKKRPIFFYSNDLDELHALKNYGRFCEKAIGIEESKDLRSFASKLEQLLSLACFSRTTPIWTMCKRLYDAKCGKANKRLESFVNTVGAGLKLVLQQEDTLIIAWARAFTAKIIRARPRSTIRTALAVCPVAHQRAPTELQIERAASKIVSEYRRRHRETESFSQESLRGSENGAANITETRATIASFRVAESIKAIRDGKERVPREHAGLCRFCFPDRDYPEVESPEIRVDSGGEKLVVLSTKQEVLGELFLGEISSIVLNDNPGSDSRSWLRVNGRRIRGPDSFGINFRVYTWEE